MTPVRSRGTGSYRFRTWIGLAGAALGFCTILSCIQRDNPFDPINYRATSQTRALARDSAMARIGVVMNDARQLDALLDTLEAQLVRDSIAQAGIADSNLARERRNDSLAAYNDSIREVNDSADAGSALTPLQTMLPGQSHAAFTTAIDTQYVAASVRMYRLQVDSIIQAYNSTYAPYVVVSDTVADSLHTILDSISTRCASLGQEVSDRINTATTLNTAVDSTNLAIAAINREILAYNEYLPYRRYSPLASVDSIQSSLGSILPGDTVVIGGGQFGGPLRIASPGSDSLPIVIAGQPDMSTVFSRSDALLSSQSGVIFRNIVFSGGDGPGFTIVNNSAKILFINCDFTGNGGDGIDITDSDVELVNCRIYRNHGNGIRLSMPAPEYASISMRNVLIAGNGLHGIEAVTTALSLTQLTVAGNGGDGVYLHDPENDLIATNTCIVNNAVYGLEYASGFIRSRVAELSNVVISGNVRGPCNATLPASAQFLTNPVSFADTAALDYAPASGTLLDTLDDAGIVIGFRRP